jgi:hypothetical protein
MLAGQQPDPGGSRRAACAEHRENLAVRQVPIRHHLDDGQVGWILLEPIE